LNFSRKTIAIHHLASAKKELSGQQISGLKWAYLWVVDMSA
jgi:hypothetical protein